MIFRETLHSHISSEYKEMTKQCDYSEAEFPSQTQVQKQQKQWGINSRIMHTGNGYKLNLKSKGLFANRQLLFNAFVVLQRLIVTTSRQCSKKISRGRRISLLCQSRKFPRDYKKDLNKEVHLDFTFKLAVKQIRQNSSFDALIEQSVC